MESHLEPLYVLTAGANKGDNPRVEYYTGSDKALWRFENNMMVDRRELVLELVGGANSVVQMGNFIMADKKGTPEQKFNLDGYMFQSMVNNWAIDIPGMSPNPIGHDVYLYPQHGNKNQLWNVIATLLNETGKLPSCLSKFY